MFENHKAALAFAGVVLVGTAIFAESQSGSADKTEPEIIVANEPKRAVQSEDDAEDAPTDEELAEAGWAMDDDLIDDAIGFSTDPDVEATPDESTQPDSTRPALVEVEQQDNAPPSSSSRTYQSDDGTPRMVPGKPSSSGGGRPIVPAR